METEGKEDVPRGMVVLNGEEVRPNSIYGYHSVHAKSWAYLKCPFCGAEIKVFIWSLAGCGKRCVKPCWALHATNRSFKKNNQYIKNENSVQEQQFKAGKAGPY